MVCGGRPGGGWLRRVGDLPRAHPAQLRRHSLLRQINEQAHRASAPRLDRLPETPVEVPPEHQATAGDLDLFGHASLFHFAVPAQTPTGIRVLRDWLLEPAAPDEIVRRQQAVVELAPRLDLRQTLILEGRLLADRGNATGRFLAWAEERSLAGRSALAGLAVPDHTRPPWS